MKTELIPAIKNQAAARRSSRVDPTLVENHQAPDVAMPIAKKAIGTATPELVVIGISTGGPAALATMLNGLPKSFPVPVLIVQHMPPTFTHLLAERLNKTCPLTVVEATHDAIVEPGHVFIAPGSHHLRVGQAGGRLQLHLDEGQPENSCRPSVDVLFRSAAMVCGDSLLGVVMTGMGKDGLAGSQNIKDGGGSVVVQDELSSIVWGMPGEVVRSGLADLVLPLDQIADTLTKLVTRPLEPVKS